MYTVNANPPIKENDYFTAIRIAQRENATITEDATQIVRWEPAPEISPARMKSYLEKKAAYDAAVRCGLVEEKPKKVTFNSDRYVESHGKNPRGRGGWIFSIDGEEVNYNGTLTEAKKALRADHPRGGIAHILP